MESRLSTMSVLPCSLFFKQALFSQGFFWFLRNSVGDLEGIGVNVSQGMGSLGSLGNPYSGKGPKVESRLSTMSVLPCSLFFK